LGCPNLYLETGRVSETSVDGEGFGYMLSAVMGEGAVIRPMGKGTLQPARRIERSKNDSKELKKIAFCLLQPQQPTGPGRTYGLLS
jgi:hypothetical protein